ncbi:MAG: CPBP family intramembrane glutamic endopeptidase [Kineosporiaceae bacterium]
MTTSSRSMTTTTPWGGPRDSWADRTRHPVWLAAGLVAATTIASLVVAGVMAALAPGSATDIRRLVAVLVVAALAVAVVVVTGGWHRTATRGPAGWRHLGLLAVPLLVALAPAVLGFDLPATGTLAVLVAGYAATGVYEEVWHRGVVLDVLRQQGLRRSAVIGGAFFGAAHLTNVAFGQAVAVSAAQAFGAFCFGIGFSVLRWRTGAVWVLAAIHALGDLMLKITGLHGGLMWAFLVGHDTLMLLWGLWCLRGADNDVVDA